MIICIKPEPPRNQVESSGGV